MSSGQISTFSKHVFGVEEVVLRYFLSWSLSLTLTLAKLCGSQQKRRILWQDKRMLSLYLMFHKYFYVAGSSIFCGKNEIISPT